MDKAQKNIKVKRILAAWLTAVMLSALIPGNLWNFQVSADESHIHDGWIDLADVAEGYHKKVTINKSGNYYLSSDMECGVHIATEDTQDITVRLCLCGHKLSLNGNREYVRVGYSLNGTEETRGNTTVLIENGVMNSAVYAGSNTDVTVKNCTIKERQGSDGVSSAGELTLNQVSFEAVENLQGR